MTLRPFIVREMFDITQQRTRGVDIEARDQRKTSIISISTSVVKTDQTTDTRRTLAAAAVPGSGLDRLYFSRSSYCHW